MWEGVQAHDALVPQQRRVVPSAVDKKVGKLAITPKSAEMANRFFRIFLLMGRDFATGKPKIGIGLAILLGLEQLKKNLKNRIQNP